jgi:hypothetical protein
MDKREFEERKRAIWERVEQKYGFPINKELRDYVESDTTPYVDGDPEEQESFQMG